MCFFIGYVKINIMKQMEIKNKLTKKLKEKNVIDYFNLLMILSLIIFSVFLIFNFSYQLKGIFFFDTHDFLMDFFNSIRDVSHGSGVYTEKGVIYPPLANLIFLIFSKFSTTEYLATDFDDRYTWFNYTQNIILVIVFLLISFAIYYFAILKHNQGKSLQNVLFLVFTTINVPLLHTLERGNLILLTVAFIAFFFYNYKSENKILRELSLVSLAIAFGLKIYPAIFGWLLVCDKRYKEIVRVVCYAVLALLIPSFFFGGPICIWWMVRNIFTFSFSRISISIEILNIIGESKFLQIAYEIYSKLSIIVLFLTVLVFLFYSFKVKQNWKSVLYVCLIFISLPPVSAIYNWLIFIVPISMLIKEEKLNKSNVGYFIGMVLPFVFIPKFISRGEFNIVQTSNSLIMKACIIALSVMFIYEAIIFAVKFFKEKSISNKKIDL